MPGTGAPPPERPEVPDDIATRVEAAERRRGCGVQLCIGVGACLVALGIYIYSRVGRVGTGYILALALLGVGLAVACAGAAAAAWFLGPTWGQRQQHWQLQRWQREYARWQEQQRSHP